MKCQTIDVRGDVDHKCKNKATSLTEDLLFVCAACGAAFVAESFAARSAVGILEELIKIMPASIRLCVKRELKPIPKPV